VLRDPKSRARLIERLPQVDRLVLLGDVIELRHGPARSALQEAQPVLREIAQALPGGAEVVLVPGNHDHRLLAPWVTRRALHDGAAPIGLQTGVDWEPGEPLWAIAETLGPERLQVSYPGVWLDDQVYATHGHYGDRHTTLPILERLGAGVTARVVGEPRGGPGRAEDYEATLAPVYAWIDAIAEQGGPALPGSGAGMQARLWQRMSRRSPGRRAALGRILTGAGVRTAVAGLNRAGIGPLRADLSGQELRLAALRAFAEVVRRLDVSAQQVIFGHTHRAGPLPGDDLREWNTGTGARLLNTGSWVHEPAFLGRTPGQSPYRPGFAAEVSDGAPPRLINLLDRDQPDPA
jgi:predicted phosphodiesterase